MIALSRPSIGRKKAQLNDRNALVSGQIEILDRFYGNSPVKKSRPSPLREHLQGLALG